MGCFSFSVIPCLRITLTLSPTSSSGYFLFLEALMDMFNLVLIVFLGSLACLGVSPVLECTFLVLYVSKISDI